MRSGTEKLAYIHLRWSFHCEMWSKIKNYAHIESVDLKSNIN